MKFAVPQQELKISCAPATASRARDRRDSFARAPQRGGFHDGTASPNRKRRDIKTTAVVQILGMLIPAQS
jgi:hypothetical protein